jgi:XTP/dITP diphosphohydrolase
MVTSDTAMTWYLLFFATGNPHKVAEVKSLLSAYPLILLHLPVKGTEIQADTVTAIAEASARNAARTTGLPLIVEDTGLFIDALTGFPGPYASYVQTTIGNTGVLKLLDGVVTRTAEFRSTVAFCEPHGQPVSFTGVVEGRITRRGRGRLGFGFDPIFEPTGGGGRTLAEMEMAVKNRVSHRGLAVRAFAEWYVERCTRPLKPL